MPLRKTTEEISQYCLEKAKKYQEQHGVDETIDYLNHCITKYKKGVRK